MRRPLGSIPGWQPDWVAFQDGDAAWSRVQVKYVGKFAEFDYDFTANRGGFAMGRTISSASIPQLSVRFGTPAELQLLSDTLTGGCTANAGKSWHGVTAGLDPDDIALVGLGSTGPQSVSASTDFAYTIDGVAAGPQTIFAQQIRVVDNQQVLAAAIIRHGVDLPDGATVPVLDFKSAEAVQPIDASVSVSGLDATPAVVSAGFFSPGSITALSYGSPALVGEGGIDLREADEQDQAGDEQDPAADSEHAGYHARQDSDDHGLDHGISRSTALATRSAANSSEIARSGTRCWSHVPMTTPPTAGSPRDGA